MNLDYLKSFYYVAKFNSISRASKNLHISQPGLSAQIKKLESELDHTLLIRSNQGVLLTSIGEVVFDYAKSIFKLEESLYSSINDLNNKKDRLSVAVCKNFGSYYFASKVHRFKEIYQNSHVTMDTYNSLEILNKVLNHDYNIGIVIRSDNFENLEITNFFNDELVFCTNSSYPKDVITVKEFLTLPLILREENSSSYSLINSLIESLGFHMEDLNILFSCNCMNIIKDSIINGSGFTFLPKSSIEFELKKNLLKAVSFENIDMHSYFSFNYSFIKRKQYDLNFYEKKFRDLIFNI